MDTLNTDYREYALFEYNNIFDPNDTYKLGDIVYNNEINQVGVIIQLHGNEEYRTDMFGNCSNGEIKPATTDQAFRYILKTGLKHSKPTTITRKKR